VLYGGFNCSHSRPSVVRRADQNQDMPSFSATITTLNEAENIARTIRSLAMADEIVVVDSGSTDATVEIARQLGARVVHHQWEGFAAQKNFAAREARHDWILSLDADEELNTDAQAAVTRWKGVKPRVAGYRLARRARYLGRWILHSGWYPDYKLRLYDRRAGEWRGSYVHESAVVSGPVETLLGEILHYTCDSLEDHQRRIELYTDLAAREMIDRGAHVNLPARVFAPSWKFFHTYFLRLGILDGYQGFLIARMAARYVRRKYQKWIELKGRSEAVP
jgi:glycosyltransferase involved in cell wall biosynthesis